MADETRSAALEHEWAEHGREASLLLSCAWHDNFFIEMNDAWKQRVERALDARERLIRVEPKPKPDGGQIHA